MMKFSDAGGNSSFFNSSANSFFFSDSFFARCKSSFVQCSKLFFSRHFPDFLFEIAFNMAIQIGRAPGTRRGLNTFHHFR